MKTLRLLSLCLIGSALTLSTACTKDSDDPGVSSGASTAGDGDGQDENDDENDGDTDTGDEGMTTFGTGDGDGDDDTTTAGTMTFVPDEDFAQASECDPWAQDCPEGEKCVAYASTGGGWDANKCVEIMGDGQEGDPCFYGGAVESTDDCDEGLWCWNVDEEGMGVCTSLCTGTPDDPICEPGYGCSIANEGSINICLPKCDPLLQDCPEGTVCFYDFGGNFVCAFNTQDIPTGEPCGFINDCVAGNVCLGAEALPSCNGASCCVAFCDLTDPQCGVSPGTECTPFFEEGTADPEYEDVGVCVIPG